MEVVQKLHFDECDMENEELNFSCRRNSSGCDIDDALDTSAENEMLECPEISRIKTSLGLHTSLPNYPLARRLFSSMDCSDNESTPQESSPNDSTNNNNKTPPNSLSSMLIF